MRASTPRALAAAIAVATAMLAPRSAAAEDRVDPLVGVGGVLLGAASIGIGIGAPLTVSWAPQERQVCGINGCITATPTYGNDDNFPSIMLGAGIGAAAVAIPSIIIGVVGRTPPVGARSSEGRMNFGVWLLGMGASLAGAGIGAAVHGHGLDAPARAVGRPLGVAGGVLMAAGIPFAITGALRADTAPPADLRLKNPAAMYAGMALTTLAVPTVAGGAYMVTQGDYGTAFGLGMLVLGSGLLSGGIAAWAIGAREISAAPTAFLPNVHVGPGSIRLEGTF